MSRLLPAPEFATWLTAFLPGAACALPASLFEPVEVTDRSDGRLGHLSGLLLSRAWACAGLASALPAGDTRVGVFARSARLCLAAGLPDTVSGNFVADHWLVTFALLALQSLESLRSLQDLDVDSPPPR